METKTCLICKQPKPFEEFWKQDSSKDGRLPYCKPCDRQRKKNYAQSERGKQSQKEASSRWRKTEAGKARLAAATKRFRKENPSRASQILRRAHLKGDYGISIEEYDHLLMAQDGRCAICGEPITNRKALAVDHNHETDKNRGLLCELCNRGLGMFRDSREILLAAVVYLDAWA